MHFFIVGSFAVILVAFITLYHTQEGLEDGTACPTKVSLRLYVSCLVFPMVEDLSLSPQLEHRIGKGVTLFHANLLFN